ncbi:MAG: arginine--tRNA ligase [Candidatus Zixiibacteriota bacterium]
MNAVTEEKSDAMKTEAGATTTTLDVLRNKFAETLLAGLKASYSDKSSDTDLPTLERISLEIERPRNTQFGDLAFPLFSLLKTLKRSPQQIFDSLTEDAPLDRAWGTLSLAGAYVNFTANPATLASMLFAEDRSADGRFGSSVEGAKRRVLVEFSSPNIAKPFGIGHLRSTVIGACLDRVFEFLGYDSISINYLGDWGTQFGKMIVAYRRWNGENSVSENAVRGALDLYTRFHEEEPSDPSLTEDAREAFRKLEQGDPKTVRLWKMFKDISRQEFDRVYKTLGVSFDVVTGESLLNDKMDSVIERLENAGLTSISQGALVVNLDEFNLPPCLLRKQDGATLYATRDIAGLIYRWETYPFHESLYVVGAAQADHFKQVYTVVDLLEKAERIAPEKRMSGRVKHIPFGWVKFEDRALSTRSGNIIFLDDVLNKATELAKKRIKDKNPDLKDADTVAGQIGVGAIIFSQLSVRKQKDVNFSWDAALSFEGETGPYLQYTHARLSALLRRYEQETPELSDLDTTHLESPETHQLLVTLARFPEVVRAAGRDYEPFLIATYLLELASLFNTFYQQKDSAGQIVRIISDDKDATDARMALVEVTRGVMFNGLRLLGLAAPEEM